MSSNSSWIFSGYFDLVNIETGKKLIRFPRLMYRLKQSGNLTCQADTLQCSVVSITIYFGTIPFSVG